MAEADANAGSPGFPARWEKGEDKPFASCRIFEVRERIFRHPAKDRSNAFYVIRSPDWVNVLALTADLKLVLVRQFRFGIEDVSLEIPGGMVEQGEDPVAAALRELREETGYVAASGRLLASVRPNPAIQTNLCHLVLAENATAGAATSWDADEELQTVAAEVDDVFRWAREGKITHALVLNALFHFEPIWRERRGRPV